MLLINPFMVKAAAPPPTNMLTNPGFSSSTGWTLANNSGSSSIANGRMQFRDSFGDVDRLSQTVAGLTNGISYILSGTISGRTAGALNAFVGGTSFGATISSNGTFTRTVTAGAAGTVQFFSSGAGGVFDLDDVSCVPA